MPKFFLYGGWQYVDSLHVVECDGAPALQLPDGVFELTDDTVRGMQVRAPQGLVPPGHRTSLVVVEVASRFFQIQVPGLGAVCSVLPGERISIEAQPGLSGIDALAASHAIQRAVLLVYQRSS